MEKLLTPDWGLLFWTVVNFALLAFVLGKFAWKPVIKALEDRENKISRDKEEARSARDEAVKIKTELEARLAGIADEAQSRLRAVESLGEAQKQALIKEAQNTSSVLLNQAKAEIEAQKNAAVAEVKREIADIAVAAARKIAAAKIDAEADAGLIQNIISEVGNKEFKA